MSSRWAQEAFRPLDMLNTSLLVKNLFTLPIIERKYVSNHMKGVDYVVTLGICLENSGAAWFDLVVMTR